MKIHYTVVLSLILFLSANCREKPDHEASENAISQSTAALEPESQDHAERPEVPKDTIADGRPDNRGEPAAESIQFHEEISKLIESSGLAALEVISSSYSGKQQDNAMVIAVGELSKTNSKSTLLDVLGKLSPGSNKQKWIWSAIARGQGGYDADLFSSIRTLSYPEEKTTAIHAFASTSSVADLDALSTGLEFLGENGDLDPQFIESMKKNLINHYSTSIYKRGPEYASQQLKNLPEDLRADTTEKLTKTFMWSNPSDALAFANELIESPQTATSAYSTLFKELGRSQPDDFDKLVSDVPEEYRTASLQSFVDGWIAQDSIAASKWLLAQPEERRVTGAASVVKFLEHKRASQDEIQPWKEMIPND